MEFDWDEDVDKQRKKWRDICRARRRMKCNTKFEGIGKENEVSGPTMCLNPRKWKIYLFRKAHAFQKK